MEEYRSNSIKTRDTAPEPIVEKRVEPVVSGGATTQKKTRFGKFISSMIAQDAVSVGEQLWSEVLIPDLKKGLQNLVVNGIDMLLYGRPSGSRTFGSTASKVSYGNFYQRSYGEPVKAGSNGSAFDYDNIVFDNRGDAEAVLTSMEDLLDQFEVVSVADLYELADIAAPNYTANKYGWTSLKGASIIRCRDGYIIKLPRCIVLDKR